jgi:hypothetical protein
MKRLAAPTATDRRRRTAAMKVEDAPAAVPPVSVGLPEPSRAAASSTINRTPVAVTPLALPGASGGPPPPCHLLEMGGVTILLDVGLDSSLDVSSLEPLRAVAPRVDALLVSHADLAHIGGLPYAFKALGLSCPVYATLPVVKLGQMTLYDAHENARLRPVGGPAPFDLDDVDAAFRRCVELKYSQQVGEARVGSVSFEFGLAGWRGGALKHSLPVGVLCRAIAGTTMAPRVGVWHSVAPACSPPARPSSAASHPHRPCTPSPPGPAHQPFRRRADPGAPLCGCDPGRSHVADHRSARDGPLPAAIRASEGKAAGGSRHRRRPAQVQSASCSNVRGRGLGRLLSTSLASGIRRSGCSGGTAIDDAPFMCAVGCP